MNRLFLFSLFALLVNGMQAQTYSRVRVYANAQQQAQLHQAGVCLDHGKHKQNTWIETDLSAEEINILQQQGIKTDILVADVQALYQQTSTEKGLKATTYCGNSFEGFNNPVHFKYGTMGGYPTYTQIMSDLDSMYILYPGLVKQKTAIAPYTTQNGHTIDWMRISDNPNVNENEPKMLITALHHAREPASVHQLLYFMWYLLENYGTNPEITWLLDHTEIYFVPVVNPDGYLYNESTNPGGGGMWRKNRRNNGDGTYGVDLNRNYSYQWGVSGTSGTTSSDVYKGPSAFSEPETQAIRDFTILHQFKLALNYHTYGNLLLHPYGYDYVATPDDAYFTRIGSLLVSESDLISEQAVTLYPAAGDSDDWMYGDISAKPKVFALTPEVGPNNLGFWPPMAQIENICHSTMFQNMTAVKLLHYYCRARETNQEVYRNGSLTQYFKYDLEKLGLADTGTTTVSLIPLSPIITATGAAKTYTNLAGFVVQADSISFTLDASVTQGQSLQFVLECTNPMGIMRDTITKYFGTPAVLLNHDFTSLTGLVNSGFATTNTGFVSGPFSLTDSPGGNYSSGANKNITTAAVTIPGTAVFAQVKFYAKWAIEDGYDYAQFQISTDGTTFDPLCGKYTNKGTGDQQLGEPLYDGSMSTWVLEEINLNNYIGQTIQLRLQFRSDAGVNLDGFYMDDLVVEIINPAGVNETGFLPASVQVWPNPAHNEINIFNSSTTVLQLTLTDVCGKVIRTQQLQKERNTLDVSQLENGYYFFCFTNDQGQTFTQKVNIIR